jgi:hypothetical protein
VKSSKNCGAGYGRKGCVTKALASLQIQNNEGASILAFDDWATYALPPERKKLHWKEGRSGWELGRVWTEGGEPGVPRQLAQLLESHEGTRRIVILSGTTERESTELTWKSGWTEYWVNRRGFKGYFWLVSDSEST